eukprot:836655-Rhodomonas_salina.2
MSTGHRAGRYSNPARSVRASRRQIRHVTCRSVVRSKSTSRISGCEHPKSNTNTHHAGTNCTQITCALFDLAA